MALFNNAKGIIDPREFWDLTPREISECLDDFTVREERRTKETLLLYQTLATLIVDGVARVLGAKKSDKPLQVTDLYKELFEQENEARAERELKIHKAQMIHFAEAHNARRAREQGDEGGT